MMAELKQIKKKWIESVEQEEIEELVRKEMRMQQQRTVMSWKKAQQQEPLLINRIMPSNSKKN